MPAIWDSRWKRSPFKTPPELANAAPSARGPRVFGAVVSTLGALGVWWGAPALREFDGVSVDVFHLSPLCA